MLTPWLACLALFDAAASVPRQPPEPAKPRIFRLECVLEERDDCTRQRVIRAAPLLALQDGKTGSFLHGGECSLDSGDGTSIEFVPFGFAARMKVKGLKDGRIRLDVQLENVKVEPNRPEGKPRFKSVAVRSIESVQVSETVHLELMDADRGRSFLFSIKVTVPEN